MQVITFEDYRPAPRYDSLPWTDYRVEEGETADGPWVELETQPLVPVDADPTDPQVRNITTELASDTMDLWYRLVFIDATADESAPTAPVQNTSDVTSYGTVEELFRILKLRSPHSDNQVAAAERVLAMATGEINSEIDLADDTAISGWQVALATEVALERASELWTQQEVPLGFVGLGTEFGPNRIGNNTWEKYSQKLAPLKGQWGIA